MRIHFRDEYGNFLRRLLYCIDHVDWNEARAAKMTKLLCSIEDKNMKWEEGVKPYQARVEAAIISFEEGKLSEYELEQKIVEVLKELK